MKLEPKESESEEMCGLAFTEKSIEICKSTVLFRLELRGSTTGSDGGGGLAWGPHNA